MEFLNVVTRQQLESPLTLKEAIQLVQDYLETGVVLLHPKPTQLETLLALLQNITSRQNLFDIALVATLKDHGITGLYTANTKDFEGFPFLDIKNPL